MSEVIVDNLTVMLGGRALCERVSFTVRQGEVTSLVGPNAAGKTTTIRSLLGLVPGYDGSVRVEGREIRTLSSHERAAWFAYIGQERAYQGTGMTVEQVVETGRTRFFERVVKPGPHHYEMVERAISLVGAQSLRHRLFDNLSGGEQQRVLIASAVAQEARFLILDEPTTFLDVCAAREVMEVLKSLSSNQGIGVLFVCHDLALILSYARRVIAMMAGGVVFFGSSSAFLSSPVLETLYAQPLRVIPDPLDKYPCLVPR